MEVRADMTHKLFGRHGLGASIAAAALVAAVPAAAARSPQSASAPSTGVSAPATPVTTTHGAKPAPAPVPTTACTPPAVSQPFTAFGDRNHYTLAPGQAADAFTGTGWTLTGGARVVSSRLQDGTQGTVLDLPAGARAVSPPMCVTNLDPTARAMVRDLSGSAGVDVRVTYLTRHGHTVSTGNVKGRAHAWSLSRTVRIHPSSTSGWQLATFTLVPRGNRHADYRVYDFYVDPRMVH